MSNETLKKPAEWAEEDGIVIINPDGWRIDGKSFDEPVSREEYESRMVDSTIRQARR